MTTARLMFLVALTALAAIAAGCGGRAALVCQADATCEAVTRAARDGPADPGPTGEADPAFRQTLYFAPRAAAGQDAPAAGAGPAGAAAGSDAGAEAAPGFALPAAQPAHVPSIKGMSMGKVLVDDLKSLPQGVGRGMKHTWARPENLIILGAAFGADRIVRHNWDGEVRDELRNDDTSLAETGDFGSIVGNPALHFGIAGAWYLTSIHQQDQDQYAKSRTMFQALLVNGISTTLLKWGMDDESPNDEEWGWPSGHASSSMCFASVMHQYYGWKAGVPLYLLAGYSAATRIEDREHDVSDVVFGTALGLVIGHSVVQGELPQVAGFTLLPYGGREAGGLMLMKRW
jgi:hypothetical protein